MKFKFLAVTLIATFFSLYGYAQTKGTNALSFGVNIYNNKSEFSQTNSTEFKNSSFTLGYGVFTSDNSKIGFELNYGNNESIFNNKVDSEGKNYGGNLSYQHYYPIVKTLYAYAGGRATYNYSKISYNVAGINTNNSQDQIGNLYSVGAYGGVTWFLSKRFAFEASLLSADMTYTSTEREEGSGTSGVRNKTTNFNLSSQGFVNNFGFKIYLLF